MFGYARFEFYGHYLNLILPNGGSDKKVDYLRLPLPDPIPAIYIDPQSSIDQIAKCSGLRVYDCALPYGWVQKEYLDRGLAFPVGVWSYDEHKSIGGFVSLETMVGRIAGIFLLTGLISLGLPMGAKLPTPDEQETSDTRRVLYSGDVIRVLTGGNGQANIPQPTINVTVDYVTPDAIYAWIDGQSRRVHYIGRGAYQNLASMPEPIQQPGDIVNVAWHGIGDTQARIDRVDSIGVWARRLDSASTSIPYLLHWFDGEWRV